jgi:PAS domain S-box-containing protein
MSTTNGLGPPVAFPELEAEPFLSTVVKSSNVGVVATTIDGIVAFWNDAAERLYGYREDEMLGRDYAVLLPPERPLELSSLLRQVRAGHTVLNYETERLRKDGSRVAVSITLSPVVGADGVVLGLSSIAHDLTLHNLQIADLREAHRLAAERLSTLETLHRSAPVGLSFMDRDFRVLHLNSMLAGLMGSTVEEQVGRTVAENVPEIWPELEPVLRHVMDDDVAVLNVEVSRAFGAGGLRHWLASYYPVHHHDDIIGIGLVAVDITELRQAEEFRSIVMSNMAEGLMTVDAQGRLTSLNKAAERMLGWDEGELIGLVMGDFVLSQGTAGETIAEGDRELLAVRAEGRHVVLEDHAYRCKNGSLLSVAVSASPLLSGDAIDGAIVVFRDITNEKSERLRLTRELAALTWVGRIREALDEDRLVLYSQPIVPLRGGRPSEELLLRMVGRREGEIIGPDAFLRVAEKYGLIIEIDQWVVKQAIRLASTGRHVGANLSAESIIGSDLLMLIDSELHRTGADPANLVFEITETALMRDMEKAHAFARGIAERGCAIALDDFGTGFGTFTHVKNLDIKYLKIDIEFVRGLITSDANQHVVKAIVNLAQGFGCETVAEGIEDGETLELLKALGVDYAQGFYLGRPAPQ